MRIKRKTTSAQKRQAVIRYFDLVEDWHTVRDLADYLGTTCATARYYIDRLIERGYLEVRSLKIEGRDGIKRATNHYKKTDNMRA